MTHRLLLLVAIAAISSCCAFAQGWVLQNPFPVPISFGLTDVEFTDVNTGVIVGYNGAIYRTTNGGSSWLPKASGTAIGLYAVSFGDANNGTAVGRLGTIVRTTNGGITWTLQNSGLSDNLWGVAVIDANTSIAV